MFKKSLIAAAAVLTIAASMATTPAQALSKKGAFVLGLGAATAIGITAAHAGHGRHYGHYGHLSYGHGHYGGHRWNYRRAYKRAARKCAYRFGRHTWRWERCMARHGF